ncbi:unnamed protein product [Nippostrongylus brasiliensis]|uniref:Gag/pol protein n=1 Tax=Nippostrongylus brasiliensis TaxID=27835 RepID=A0A0N4XIA0_NIPBR|nr:unnamed protein product [Nippostrongylus brasiliensis]
MYVGRSIFRGQRYWCGIQANLYSMMKHPSDESIQRMGQLAECMKQQYMDTRVENSDKQKRGQRLSGGRRYRK